jgi:hypothetical protein
MAIKVVYKNQCTPQEKVNFSSGHRWYTDSDCGRKLSGSATITLATIDTYTADVAVSSWLMGLKILFLLKM